MDGNILQEWAHCADSDNSTLIIPDGCRDLLYWAAVGERPKWYVTSLDNAAYNTDIKAGDYLKGYRLRPGACVDVAGLLDAVKPIDENGDIVTRINDFTSLSLDVSEALECVAVNDTVSLAAVSFGVSARKLQRICVPTGRTAAAWMSLARARKAAREVLRNSLAEVAQNTGYSDQAHMSREFRRWFGIAPSTLHARPDIIAQLGSKGYF